MFWSKENTSLKNELKTLGTELEKEQGKAARLAGFMARLQSFGITPHGEVPLRPFAEALVDTAHALLHVEQVVFFTVDAEKSGFMLAAARGFSPDALSRMKINSSDEIQNFLGKPQLVLPLLSMGSPIGLFAVAKPASGTFSAEDHSLASLLAAQSTLLLGSYALYRQEGSAHRATVETLIRAIEAKDSYTHLHGSRIKTLVRATCAEMSLPDVLVQQIEDGAYLHDVGKIGVPDSILKKTGELTAEEREIMKSHSVIGHKILEPFPSLRAARAIVLYHQEWYNGAGYPEGLAGEEIPLGARTVQILDAWDAMTSDRPYRGAMSKSLAIAELRRQSGSQFDPKLIDLFLRTIDKLERSGINTTETPNSQTLASRQA